MGNPNLLPYETIVRATSGEPEAVDKVLQHYGKQIRLASLENGHINKDTEDSIKQRLVTALFKFRFDEQPYKKLNNRRPSQRHTMTGNQKKISCFFALIFGIFKNRQYCAVQRGIRKKSSLPFGKSASCLWRADKEKMCPVCLAVFNFWWCGK